MHVHVLKRAVLARRQLDRSLLPRLQPASHSHRHARTHVHAPRGAAAQAAALDGRARARARPAPREGGAFWARQQGGGPPRTRPCDLANCRADAGGDAAAERARDAGRRGGRPRRALARAPPGGAHVRPPRSKKSPSRRLEGPSRLCAVALCAHREVPSRSSAELWPRGPCSAASCPLLPGARARPWRAPERAGAASASS